MAGHTAPLVHHTQVPLHHDPPLCCNTCKVARWACACACSQAVRDVDKLLAGAYEERAKARAQGKHFADDSAFQGCVHTTCLRLPGREGSQWFHHHPARVLPPVSSPSSPPQSPSLPQRKRRQQKQQQQGPTPAPAAPLSAQALPEGAPRDAAPAPGRGQPAAGAGACLPVTSRVGGGLSRAIA